jgi:RNA polymerase sigma factor (sigma-70 family)
MSEAENHVLPGATTDTWRTWLMTGARHSPVDRRRIRGDHVGLKRMLLEGMSDRRERPHAWKDFSGAMIRHAIDEAMRSLPPQDTQVVKLAYFGGYSNKQVAQQVGLTEATVQRRLKRALSSISASIHRGRVLARRAMYAVMVWMSGRRLSDSAHHFVQSVAVAATAVIVVSQPAPVVTVAPTRDSQLRQTTVTTTVTTSAPSRTTVAPPMPSVTVPAVKVPQVPTVQLPTIQLPVSLPTPTPLPTISVKPPV